MTRFECFCPHFTRTSEGVETCARCVRALYLNSAGGPPISLPSMGDVVRGDKNNKKILAEEMKSLRSSSITNIHDFLQGESNCYFS